MLSKEAMAKWIWQIVSMQSGTPLAVLGALHFEAITDLAWSCDGSLLVIASYDGYCRYACIEHCLLPECAGYGADAVKPVFAYCSKAASWTSITLLFVF